MRKSTNIIDKIFRVRYSHNIIIHTNTKNMKLLVNLQYDFEYQGFVADCPALPGCMSQGKTKKQALKNIKEAILGYVKTLKR